jgi:subtilisin family serine protease
MKNIQHHLDDKSRKLHPWLRIVRNGDRIVNTQRSDGSTRVATLASTEKKALKPASVNTISPETCALPRWTEQIETRVAALPKRAKMAQRPPAHDVFVNIYIEFFPAMPSGITTSQEIQKVKQEIKRRMAKYKGRIPATIAERRNFLCATVPVTYLTELVENDAVAYVHPSEPLKLDPLVTVAPAVENSRASTPIRNTWPEYRGKGVLIGIIDVGGFDFSHPDFLDADNKTRFLAIWDQGGDFRAPPEGFDYGSEFLKEHLDAALADAAKPGLPPATWIERQSQLEIGSHATHVASIAAGNSGVCPDAMIAAVLIDVPAISDDFQRRRATFSDTSRITHAVEYLLDVAKKQDMPIAINISLGTNGGSHDGSSGVSRWLDAYLNAPGRAICVAAGNAGQEKAQDEDDLGWIMGRIHTSGQIMAKGLEVELEWTVVGDGLEDVSENELEIWYGPQDRFVVALKPPNARDWIEVQPREYVENRRLEDGTTVSIYNELYFPTNGANYIALYLSPNYDPEHFRGIQPGVWKVRLRGEDVRDGHFDAWIERDDPMEIGRENGRRLFRFPSFFTEKTNVDSHSITSLACGHRVVAVANLDEARQRINASSSQGPTRDGRCKPEIAAPGTNIVAANGFSGNEELWIEMSGTSMAAPYVTGVVGLMLAVNPSLTSAQCQGILQRTARPLPGGSYRWINDLGFGWINPPAAIEEARTFNNRVELSNPSQKRARRK